MDPDSRVAVVAFELQREAEVERGALVRFGHDAGVLGEDRWEKLGEPLPQAGRRTIWGVGEYQVIRAGGIAEERQRVAPEHGCVDADRGEVALDGGRVGVDE